MTNTKAILGISLAAVFVVSMIMTQSAQANSNGVTHLDIKDIALVDNGDGTASAKITTATAIYNNGNFGAYGYGFITALHDTGIPVENIDDTIMLPENVLAFTSHVCAADSLVQGDINEVKRCPNGQSIGVLEALQETLGLPENVDDQLNDGPLMHPHILDLTKTALLPEEDQACADLPTELNFSGIEVDVGRTIDTENNISPFAYNLIVRGNTLGVDNVPLDDYNLLSADLAAYASFNIVPTDDGNGNITHLCLTDLTVTPVG
ncbi:MAG: hypothetical protein OES27_00425 [Nitrosopumilus sp.]|nr:hypothetical protein [Nitrosopumilus sp.]